ncbi:MAG: hypothetical protein COU27_02825 [Candidatus Levybacteria bacterium CG10_big_fil_rev_8_21_14_0_10_36_7]|nr:MAG: hypothetical protein COU27_02825 [Candidatus Levybacteria bacterium CG10_big_fil_rev_8_21_14_0_10_36_7]
MKKGDITFVVLEKLIDSAQGMGELFEVFFADYQTSYRKLRGLARKKRDRFTAEELSSARHNFSALMSRLQKDGLVKKLKGTDAKQFLATQEGVRKFKVLQKRRKRQFPESDYDIIQGKEFIIITFDIPESERGKRDWLRSALKYMEFKMVQKSVWIGKTKLPEDFLKDLHEFSLVEYIEIFKATRQGSLRFL